MTIELQYEFWSGHIFNHSRCIYGQILHDYKRKGKDTLEDKWSLLPLKLSRSLVEYVEGLNGSKLYHHSPVQRKRKVSEEETETFLSPTIVPFRMWRGDATAWRYRWSETMFCPLVPGTFPFLPVQEQTLWLMKWCGGTTEYITAPLRLQGTHLETQTRRWSSSSCVSAVGAFYDVTIIFSSKGTATTQNKTETNQYYCHLWATEFLYQS